jgi:hypothetical protein
VRIMLTHKRVIARIVLDHKRVIFRKMLAHNRSACLDSFV